PVPPATRLRFARTGRDRSPAPARAPLSPVYRRTPHRAGPGRTGAGRRAAPDPVHPAESAPRRGSPGPPAGSRPARPSGCRATAGRSRPTPRPASRILASREAWDRRTRWRRARVAARRSHSPDQDTAIRQSPPVVPGKNRDHEAFWEARTRARAPEPGCRGSSSRVSGGPEPPHELGADPRDVAGAEGEHHVPRLERLVHPPAHVGP